jgi:hypothetical protein
MKTLEQIKAYPGGENCNLIDSRDKKRLLQFLPVENWKALGFSLKDGAEVPTPTPLTRETVLENLANDLEFAFEKAHNKRGISASLMGDVIKMWMWILDDEELMRPPEWSDYGIAYLERVAKKYSLPVPA